MLASWHISKHRHVIFDIILDSRHFPTTLTRLTDRTALTSKKLRLYPSLLLSRARGQLVIRFLCENRNLNWMETQSVIRQAGERDASRDIPLAAVQRLEKFAWSQIGYQNTIMTVSESQGESTSSNSNFWVLLWLSLEESKNPVKICYRIRIQLN